MSASDAVRVTVRLDDDLSIVATLPDAERTRLLIRVLCELVAYDEAPARACSARPQTSYR